MNRVYDDVKIFWNQLKAGLQATLHKPIPEDAYLSGYHVNKVIKV